MIYGLLDGKNGTYMYMRFEHMGLSTGKLVFYQLSNSDKSFTQPTNAISIEN